MLGNVATTAKRRAALRASASRRTASLSLAETGKRAPTGEIGDASVSYVAGTGKLRRLLDTEYLWDLRGQAAYRAYDQMRFSDPKVAGLRFAQNLPLLRASVTIEPSDGDDKDAVAKAELVKRLLIDEFPWRSFLADTTLALDYGFAAFEIVWRIEGGEAKFRLSLRPASSIAADDIYLKDGAVDHVVQRPVGGGSFEIPGDRLLWFSYNKEGDDFRGHAMLRPMYKPWRLKQEIELQLAVLIGKMGGVPVFTQHTALDQETQDMLDEAGQSFGIAAGAFVRKPADVDLELLSSNVSVDQVLESVKYWDTQLTAVAQAQVLDLGINQAGSRAMGSTMLDMFGDSIQSQCSYREDVLNAKGGLVHQIVAYNFPNDENLPKLRFGNVQRSDIRAMAQAFMWLAQAGMGFGDEDWEFIRAEMNMPESRVAQVDMPDVPEAVQAPPPAEVPAPAPPESPATAGDALEGGAQASEAHTHGDGLQLAERRSPRGVEIYLDLAEIVAKFDTAKTAVKDATQATRTALAAELGRRARVAADKGQLAKFAAGAPPMVDKLTSEIGSVLEDFFGAGRQQVADELQRQRDGKPWTARSIRAAEAKSPGGPPPKGLKAMLQQAAAMARSIAAATMAAASMQAARILAGTPVAPDVMEAMILRESDAAALRFVGAAVDFLSMGRTAEATAQAQDIEDAVYSALLDGATCDACEPMDGEVTTDLALAEEWTPNPDCEGGERCRCLVVYQIRQEPPGPTLAESVLALTEVVAKQKPSIVNVAAPATPDVTVNVAAAEPANLTATVVLPEPAPEPAKRGALKRESHFLMDEAGRITGKVETETDSAGRAVVRTSTFQLDESGRIVGKTETESEGVSDGR
jgi:hypothetical protein